MSHKRTIKFVQDLDGRSDNEVMLKDTSNDLLVHCAFDKHGYCRTVCASLAVEGKSDEITCLRLGGIIGVLDRG